MILWDIFCSCRYRGANRAQLWQVSKDSGAARGKRIFLKHIFFKFSYGEDQYTVKSFDHTIINPVLKSKWGQGHWRT